MIPNVILVLCRKCLRCLTGGKDGTISAVETDQEAGWATTDPSPFSSQICPAGSAC